MKYNIINLSTIILMSLTTASLYGQVGNNEQKLPGSNKGNWYKESTTSGKIGIGLEEAKTLLKGKKIGKNPIVAIINSGVDLEHEALNHAIWVNPNETSDGVDNDKNGYVDDTHGWNFIGSKDGEFMESTLSAANNLWFQLKDKYADMFFDGKKYFKITADGRREYLPNYSDIEGYKFFEKLLTTQQATIGNSYTGYKFAYIFKEYVEKWDKEIMAAFPGKSREEVNHKEAELLVINEKLKKDSLGISAATIVFMYGNMMKPYVKDGLPSWKMIYDNFTERQAGIAYKSYERNLKEFGANSRAQIVGDNPLDFNDRDYGNNRLFTTGSTVGTLLSGIIAGQEIENSGLSGILPTAKLMHLVVSTQSGDPYPKDIALAIRYAVEQGADIILLPAQNSFYTKEQKEWIDQGLSLAEKKGVLVITSVWERSENIDNQNYYPSQTLSDGKRLSNLLIVGNSDEQGIPSPKSNYGQNEVSLYAPGLGIYSSFPGDVYKTATSGSNGAAVTAGAAAFLKAYFPHLSGEEIKQLLMKNVYSKKGEVLERSFSTGGKSVTDLFLFEQLCTAAGILNLESAVEGALKMKSTKSK